MTDTWALDWRAILVMAGIGGVGSFVFWKWDRVRRLGDKKRHLRNRAFAESEGWSYLPRDDSLLAVLRSPTFDQGDKRRVSDVMRGTYRGRELLVFGYQYDKAEGDDQITYHHHVCTVTIPGRVPLVRVTPKSRRSRLEIALGGTDIKVESDEFNRLWRVWSRNGRMAHAILTPRLIERLLERDAIGQPLAFEPGYLMTYDEGKLDLPSSQLPLDLLCDIADLVPAFLAKEYPAKEPH